VLRGGAKEAIALGHRSCKSKEASLFALNMLNALIVNTHSGYGIAPKTKYYVIIL